MNVPEGRILGFEISDAVWGDLFLHAEARMDRLFRFFSEAKGSHQSVGMELLVVQPFALRETLVLSAADVRMRLARIRRAKIGFEKSGVLHFSEAQSARAYLEIIFFGLALRVRPSFLAARRLLPATLLAEVLEVGPEFREFLASVSRGKRLRKLVGLIEARTGQADLYKRFFGPSQRPWTSIGFLDEFSEEVSARAHEEGPLLVYRSGDSVRVFENVCPHRGAPLETGEVREGVVYCPLHGWPFSLRSGGLSGDARISLLRFPSKVEQGQVWVQFGESDLF